jgi:UDP-glucuronate 4-epimerase
MRYFITGTAGFIGYHLAARLLREGHEVTGYDGMTQYYDVTLKQRRHDMLREFDRFKAHEALLEDQDALAQAVETSAPDVIVHLAAQAGVRYSLENPRAYINANLVGTFNVLEEARKHRVGHLLLASTSSVYGANAKLPFSEDDRADHPLTLYAATKKATEGMAHSYSHLWQIPTTAFRFFTVYGPWGRPDMALFKFVEATLNGRPIEVYNHGRMERDFTYIDDLVEAIVRLAVRPPGAPGSSEAHGAPFQVLNIGNSQPVNLLAFIEAIEEAIGRKVERKYLPMQPGDVPRTWADTTALERLTGFAPATPVRQGVAKFVDWYRGYYRV